MDPAHWSRRTFLRAGAAATGGLLVTVAVSGCRPSNGSGADPRGRLGVRTALPMIISEEQRAEGLVGGFADGGG